MINYFHELLWCCHMSNEIIQNITDDNYDNFQHLDLIFSHFCWIILFNNKIDLKVR